MSRPIAPGQTVPVPFTLSEMPDSTPTVMVIQSTAAGVLSNVSATTSPTVTLFFGLEYHAYFTVPADAVHGSAYRLHVSVKVGGLTTAYWLDGGTVALWASQASVDEIAEDVAAVKAKTDLITSGGVSVVSPTLPGGRIVVAEGFDYASDGGSAEITITEAAVGDWDDARLAADSFGFHARYDGEDDVEFTVTGVTLNPADVDGLRSFTFDLLRSDVPQEGAYTYRVYGSFTATERDVPIVKGTFRAERGRIVTA